MRSTRRAALVVGAQHDAVGIKEIRDRRAFAQELGVGGHVKSIRSRAPFRRMILRTQSLVYTGTVLFSTITL